MSENNKRLNIVVRSTSGPSRRLQVRGAGSRYREMARGVDLVFVIDTTGSMSDKIEGLLATCSGFVDELARERLDARLAVVAFGDLTVPGDTIEHCDFTTDLECIKDYLKHIPRNGGGGNDGESSLEALLHAMDLKFREGTVKVVILITDEPPLQSGITAQSMTERLRRREFLTFVISEDLPCFREMAGSTGGTWHNIYGVVDLGEVKAMFGQVADKVSSVVADVFRLGCGSVSKYLQLKAPEGVGE